MKRIFQILDEMNQSDSDNDTSTVAVSNILLGVDKVKQGCKISMGAEEKYLYNIADGSKIPLLILVDKEAYNKQKSL